MSRRPAVRSRGMATRSYSGSCHCGAVRFRFQSAEITSGLRCNCSICIRKGMVMSRDYVGADAFAVDGAESLAIYRFGDGNVDHYFCKNCGISPIILLLRLALSRRLRWLRSLPESKAHRMLGGGRLGPVAACLNGRQRV